MKTVLFISSTLLATCATAIKFPTKARRSGFQSEGHATDNGYLKVMNDENIMYSTVIGLGGQQFTVKLDTGSSDLWVSSRGDPIETRNKTDTQVAIYYETSFVNGSIAFADLELGDYRVSSQAFIDATEADMEALRATGSNGILGLGLDANSYVNRILKSSYGNEYDAGLTPISNIFRQNFTTRNFFTILLGRMDDPDDETEGVFTISEYVDGFEAVQDAPKLLRQKPKMEDAVNQWNVEIDGISVNGQSIGSQKLVGLLDTGRNYVPVDVKVADAIYSSIPGAVKVNSSELWLVPCESTTDVVFKLGGKEFYIHPLDLTVVKEIEGYSACVNTFYGVDTTKIGLDIILGAPFLRNAYAVFDYGDGADSTGQDGYTQLLSTTDVNEAKSEFGPVRKATLASMPAVLPPAQLAEIIAKNGGLISYTVTEGTEPEEGDPTEEDDPEGEVLELDEPSSGSSRVSSSLGGEDDPEDDPEGDDPMIEEDPTEEDDPAATGTPSTQGFSAALATDDDETPKLEGILSKLGTYGPVVIGLLAANLLFLIVLTTIGVATYVRRGGRAKTVSSTYTPVKLKDTESGVGTSYDTPYNK